MAVGSDSDSAVRRRTPGKATDDLPPAADEDSSSSKKKTGSRRGDSADDEVEYENRWVDLARVLTFLLFASCGLSYLVSGGESFFWTMKVPPKYLRAEWWKSQLVCRLPRPETLQGSLPR